MKKGICQLCASWKKNPKTTQGKCLDKHFVYTGEGAKEPLDGLGYYDLESCEAGFTTGPGFGCIHFDPHPASLARR